MTFLIASVLADDPTTLISRAEAAWSKGAEAVELRIDRLTGGLDAPRDYVASHPDRRFIITCRTEPQGGHFSGSVDGLIERLAVFGDFPNTILDSEVSSLIDRASPPARTSITSAHFLDRKPDDLRSLMENVLRQSALAKVAYAAGHVADSFDALDLMHEFRDRAIAIAMGEDGLWTRVLAKKLGAFGTFASLEADTATAPGQLTIDEMIGHYRWREIDADTKVFGVIGDPVAHSLSPRLFNHWFAEAGINAVYLPLRVRGGRDGLVRFLAGCTDRLWLDIGGFSVTIPHKEAALEWLGTPSDSLTGAVGAVNTLCFRDGQAFGYNTDCYAAVASVAGALGLSVTELGGLRIDVLGAGGAARAILGGFGEAGCRMTVFARSFTKAAGLGEQFQCDAAPWEERGREGADVLVNTTPVGMWPNVGESPMDDPGGRSRGFDTLPPYRLVFDLIYRPLETKLLRDARTAGCNTLNGLDMFLRQASVQFELWAGRQPDLASARAWLPSFSGHYRQS